MVEHLLHFGGWYLLATFALGSFFVYFLSSLRRRSPRGASRAPAHGWSGRAAEALLEERGYRILDAHCRASLAGRVNGSRVTLPLGADFLVERRGRRYVALLRSAEHVEQDSSDALPLMQSPGLLERALAFRCDGVVLLDVAHFDLKEVTFEVNELVSRNAERAKHMRRRASDWQWNQATVESLRTSYGTARSERERALIAGRLRSLGEPLDGPVVVRHPFKS